MPDRIILSRLAVYAYHGVREEEERLGQRFFVSVACALDLRAAGAADDEALSANYATLAALVQTLATERRFRTIEGLAEAIAEEALVKFPRVESVEVTVEKPEAPVPVIMDHVAVEIRRSRRG